MGELSPLRNPLGMRGSACVEVMTTLHGSTPSPWRHAEGCIPLEGTIASSRDPLSHPFYPIDATHGSLALKAYQQNLYLKYYY